MSSTRTHVFVTFANPYLICDECREFVPRWHDNTRCGCGGTFWNEPCKHTAAIASICGSWSPVDGCQCRRFGVVPHATPPAHQTGDRS